MRKHMPIQNKIINKIKSHVIQNMNYYTIIAIFFIIGIVIGVFCYNSLNEELKEKANCYINEFIQNIKLGYEINNNELLKQTIIDNIIFSIIMWFIGCTIIGLPIVYGIISFKGFSLGYTICCIIGTLGTSRGIVFSLLSLFMQNIFAIPAYLGLGVTGNKLYKSIIKDKRRENIKLAILRHTIFCLLMLLLLVIASIIESYISVWLTKAYINTI